MTNQHNLICTIQRVALVHFTLTGIICFQRPFCLQVGVSKGWHYRVRCTILYYGKFVEEARKQIQNPRNLLETKIQENH